MIAIKEFKETDPWDYSAEEDRAHVLTLPNRRFAWIEGSGDPNGPVFAAATTALYGLSYAVRMSYRSEMAPQGSGPYTVGVLQGRWDIAAGESFFDPAHKGKLTWVIMIRQPDFLDEKLFTRFREEARAKAIKKKTIEPEYFDRLRFGERDSGRYAKFCTAVPMPTRAKPSLGLRNISRPKVCTATANGIGNFTTVTLAASRLQSSRLFCASSSPSILAIALIHIFVNATGGSSGPRLTHSPSCTIRPRSLRERRPFCTLRAKRTSRLSL